MAGTELGGVPVSPPGAMSQRTDRQPIRDIPASYYGEGKELREIQQGAPMAAVPAPRPVDLFAPTERPDEPVTAGVDMGDGPGSEVMQLPQQVAGGPGTLADKMRRLAMADQSGDAQRMLAIAERLGW